MGRGGVDDMLEMSMCHACGMDLRESNAQAIESYLPELKDWLIDLAKDGLEGFDLDDWNVIHHLARLLMSDAAHLRLHEHSCRQLGAPERVFPEGRISIESCELGLRHHLINCLTTWCWIYKAA
jgi:hypothetical protein